jgi:hypothetical protein
MEEEFRAILLASSGVTALVQSDAVNWGVHPQGVPYPALVLNLISGFDGIHMNGTGPYEGRVQVDCYAMTYGKAKVISRAVVSTLNFHRSGGFLIISHLSSKDSREGGSNEAERPYRTGLDFNIKWRSTL